MRGLQYLLVRRQCQFLLHQVLGVAFVGAEGGQQEVDVAVLEVVGALLHLVLVEHVAVPQWPIFAGRIDEVEDVLDALQVHRQALQAVGDLAGDRLAVDAADLLEVGELRHFHAVEPDFPAQAPGAQRRVFPVVLDEAHVILLEVEAERFERAEIEFENVRRRGLEHHLVLVVVLHAVGVLAVAAVLGAARGLHVGGLPRLGAERAQEGGGVRGAGADLHVVGLQEGALLLVPECLEAQDDLLKRRFHLEMERIFRKADSNGSGAADKPARVPANKRRSPAAGPACCPSVRRASSRQIPAPRRAAPRR